MSQSEYVNVIVVKENVVSESFLFVGDHDTISAKAEHKLIDLCRTICSNWEDHSLVDIQVILDDGYYELVNGTSICITWPEVQ